MSQRVLEQKLQETQAAAARTQQAMAGVSAKFASSQSKLMDPKDLIDIENADLNAVHAHRETMNANIAELIMGLDDVTKSFSSDFDEMRTKTTAEKLIGFFAKGKAEAMRQERVRSSSIDDKLSDLISKSTTIKEILVQQEGVLQTSQAEVEANLDRTFAQREQVIDELETVRQELIDMAPRMADLDSQLAAATDNRTRTALETEVANLNKSYNDKLQSEQTLLAQSQTLERYIESGKTWIDSLQNQLATQRVLIAKLDTDTQQRVVLYDALIKSLKTAQQQDVAHRINEIGVETDQNAQTAMAAIGAATNTRMVEMLESHEGHMVFSQKVLEAKRRNDDMFNRRFAEIARKHDSALYQE